MKVRVPIQPPLPGMWPRRLLVWFSCGATSAVAAKIAVENPPAGVERVEVLYCRVANHSVE